MDSGSFYQNAKSRPFQTVFIFTQNNKKTLDSQGFHQQAPGRTRTGDLRITNALLYQLSHGSTFKKCCCITQQQVTCPGIEPGFTPWEGVVLTAWPTGLGLYKSRRQDSNLRPLRPERSALPNWATPRLDYVRKYNIDLRKCQQLFLIFFYFLHFIYIIYIFYSSSHF